MNEDNPVFESQYIPFDDVGHFCRVADNSKDIITMAIGYVLKNGEVVLKPTEYDLKGIKNPNYYFSCSELEHEKLIVLRRNLRMEGEDDDHTSSLGQTSGVFGLAGIGNYDDEDSSRDPTPRKNKPTTTTATDITSTAIVAATTNISTH